MSRPFSSSKKSNELLFVSGQLPILPGDEQLVSSLVYEQTLACLQNVESVICEANLIKNAILKPTLFVTNLTQLAAVNQAYVEFFESVEELPVRSAFQVVVLARGAAVEIDAVAQLREVLHV